ncbi:MAG: hypothetical protein IKO11_07425 [Lachnospiraceae bacterium]|nr:hypothetical protein [Lachnospiraceae bacterium]
MTQKEYKRFFLAFLLCAGVLLFLAALAVFLFDPFFHYHGLWLGMKGVQTKEEFQVNGALEHLDYDAVLLGASVTMNMNTDPLDEHFGCHTQKAVASGAHCCTLAYYLDKAYRNREIRYVFWGLDPDQIFYEIDDPPTQDQILYLRDKNPFNDVNYLWNADVLLQEIPHTAGLSWKNGYDPGTAYDFLAIKAPNMEEALATHHPEGEIKPVRRGTEGEARRRLEENLDLIEALVAAHPETEFKFFFTVSSILWWDIHYRDGNYEKYFDGQKRAVERLSAYDNVCFYAGVFNDRACLLDLTHYYDYCHADREVSLRQVYALINDEGIITPDNITGETDTLRDIIFEFENRLVAEDGDWNFLYEYAGLADE